MKQRNLLKGRVKHLLKEQKDMGQVGKSAVLCCALAVQIFVKDLVTEMHQQLTEGDEMTPMELKRIVLAREKLNFLHDKVTAIDENAAKYQKPARCGKKRAQLDAANKLSTKKARATRTAKESNFLSKTTAANPAVSAAKTSTAVTAKKNITLVSLNPKAQSVLVKEDEDYDESDSDV
ncbi:unnamed protein product [Peronospora belbahrii]|uniref:Transcription factor CBF/NF-Y/archaeal histone domain-containing protein n=1 Tax=Peronospora belbahrii TaxID=622444 RepID=A0ABN8CQG6_9STRA|nr:unnamed protein product [Peronospora belbahrii]